MEKVNGALSVIANYFLLEPDALCLELRLVEDLGADSLEIIEIVVALNEHFGIELSEKNLNSVQTVGDLCREARDAIEKISCR